MPTILLVKGWRFFFYADERNEPIHVHARKGGMECKYWLKMATYDLVEAFAYDMGSSQRREVRQIVFEHFAQIESEWKAFQRRKNP